MLTFDGLILNVQKARACSVGVIRHLSSSMPLFTATSGSFLEEERLGLCSLPRGVRRECLLTSQAVGK